MSRFASLRDDAIAPRSTASRRTPRGHRARLARLLGATGLVALTIALWWLLTDDAFRVNDASVRLVGLEHADEAEVRAQLPELGREPNIFRVRRDDIVSQLSSLTEVDAAQATLTLPANVTIRLDERDPLFVWTNRQSSWLVDEEGTLFAPLEDAAVAPAGAGGTALDDAVDDAAAEDADRAADDAAVDLADETRPVSPGGSARAALPVVSDERVPDPGSEPRTGTRLSPMDLAVMRLLLAVTPELLGSRSTSIALKVDHGDGYYLQSLDRGWIAYFGHYTPTVQPPDHIPRQVQCLRWLLAEREEELDTARLAIQDDRCGTFTTYGSEVAASLRISGASPTM